MIQQVHIKNYKSIVDLKLDLGRVNLFIGENGCGKTNILESIGIVGSITTSGINNALLLSKGIRLSKAELMASAFKDEIPDIEIDLIMNNQELKYKLKYQNEEKGDKWVNVEEHRMLQKFVDYLSIISKYANKADFFDVSQNDKGNYNLDINLDNLENPLPEDFKNEFEKEGINMQQYFSNLNNNPYLYNFIIYSPELSYLRKFDDEGQADPLGYRGEGLFNLIKSSVENNGVVLNEIKEIFELIDWYEDFFIPKDLLGNEYKISIKDRFIDSNIRLLDQRSVNEGFLFLLFYATLFTSDKTPDFFSIDNFDVSFNPKLCSRFLSAIVKMSKRHNKQVLLTTHNPAAIDGINIKDDSQRLFVVRRNIYGHTIVNRIIEKPKTTKPMKLSEAWMKGLLGGLPNNF